MAKLPTKRPEKKTKKSLGKKPSSRNKYSPKSKSPSGNIVVTAALPYANGDIHIGHLLEYIQTDIFVRYLKLAGKKALYICASDMHGTPIEMNAKKAGKKPEQLALEYWKEHQKDFASYLIHFDNYYKTHSPENRELVEFFYWELKRKKLIYTKKIPVVYCEQCQRSLPDRMVKGTCPHCGEKEQYGDVCEKCSSILKGIDLLNPYCTVCGSTPRQKESEHYFFRLSSFSPQLAKWISSKEAGVQEEVKNWLNNWIKKGLEDWCVSRDAPYFGFEIPDSKKETGETKYFYVWLDAPIGYIASTSNYCAREGGRWEDYWHSGQVCHFIGKDIVYFHFLFWPAMLLAAGIPLPKITVHGFITVDGQKMSKSRGTFFTARDFLKLYPAEGLRFFYASHLDRKVGDVDLNLNDFQAFNNSVLMGNLGNFCYRVLTFAGKNYGSIQEIKEEKKLSREVLHKIEEVGNSYTAQDFRSAVKMILQIADLGNAYFQSAEPWKEKEKKAAQVGWCVNLARNLAIIVSPVLPQFSRKVLDSLGEKEVSWKDIHFSWQGKVKEVSLLVEKIEKIQLAEMFPLQLKVGQIKEVKDHPNADSLYVLQVDLGGTGVKQVVAGLKKKFSADQLLGKKLVFCTNLKPAKLRGEMSEAMVLAADDGNNLSLLELKETAIGDEVHFGTLVNSPAEISFDEFLKLKMTVEKGKVWYKKMVLANPKESVQVEGVQDGAEVR